MTHNWNMNVTSWHRITRNRLNKIILVVVIGLLSVVMFNCRGQSASVKTRKDSLIFSVMGDVPRSNEEKIILLEQIRKHNQHSPAQFVFHVGDIKSGESVCDEANYSLVAGYLKKLKAPVFIVPGDNEWNDCENTNLAWNYWEKYFMAFDQNWEIPFDVQRQQDYNVNSAFVQNEVLFIALNLVGGKIHDQIEWDTMQNNAADWIRQQFQQNMIFAAVILFQANPDEKHKLFMDQFLPLVVGFERPVLLIHGDGHNWLHDDPWLVPNLVRIQVDKGGIADPLQVTVLGDTTKIFKFERYPFKVLK